MKQNLCATIQSSFSSYLDGALTGRQMQQFARHLEGFADSATGAVVPACEPCASEFAAWRQTHQAIATLRPAKAPADLGLRLRIALSHELAQRNSRLLDRLSLAWENAVRPMLLQVSAGLATSVALIGGITVLLGMVAAPPQAVQANDEPLTVITAPHYLYSTVAPGDIVTGQDAAIVVEALVDTTGRVYDYKIVSGPQDEAVRTQVADQLLSSVFQPASAFGVPVRGRAVVTFSGISVHG
jgi:hypothetical protein